MCVPSYCCHGDCVTDGEEDDKIATLRDKMIKNMELCRGRIADLGKVTFYNMCLPFPLNLHTIYWTVESTVYHETFEAEKFRDFRAFLHVHTTFYMKVQDGQHCSSMDLRESMRDSVKVFCEGLHIQLATKLFCLETFMAYGNNYPIEACAVKRKSFVKP